MKCSIQQIKKFLTILSFICFSAISTTPQAGSSGPFYLYWQETCWVLEVYLTSDNAIYGEEIGCSAADPDAGHRAAGYFDGDTAALGYEYKNDPRIYKFTMDGVMSIYQNTANSSLIPLNGGSWYLGASPKTTRSSSINTLPSPNEKE